MSSFVSARSWGAGGERGQGSLSQRCIENGLAGLPPRLRTWVWSPLKATLRTPSFTRLSSCSASRISSSWPVNSDCTRQEENPWLSEAGRNFQASWGLKTSVSLQEGERRLLSVFIEVFLFEQQPHWLWCKNKLIPKPQLETSWLPVYCLPTHTEEKRWNLVSFQEAISVPISMLRCLFYMKNIKAPLSWRNLFFLASWGWQLWYFIFKFLKESFAMILHVTPKVSSLTFRMNLYFWGNTKILPRLCLAHVIKG